MCYNLDIKQMEDNMETNKNTNILIVNSNEEYANQLKNELSSIDPNLSIEIAMDGEDGFNKATNKNYSIVLCDLVLQKIDGFELIEKLAALKNKPKILVVSTLTQETLLNKAIELGADYFITKGTNVELIYKRCKQLLNTVPAKVNHNRALDEKISNIFITVGIPAHIKGYQFLREAIKMAIDNPEIINSITKQLYPSIANRFETSASKVERAIRHAIEVAWNRGKIENINNLFGIKVYNSNEKPTNGEFIALVADKMLIEGA